MPTSLERNRVFDRATLEEVLYEGVTYMEAAIACTKGYQQSHALLKSAYERIPAAAKDLDFGAALDAFTPQDFDTTSYKNMADRLTLLINKLQTDAFAYDEIAAQELENITAQTTEIIKMVEDLKELAAGGSFLQSYDSFTKKLTDCQSRWEQKTLSLEARLLLATTMLKGMETCSEYSKDPVNLSTGNFIYEKTDLLINASLPLSFTRYYNAMDIQKSAIGRGWIHNYAEYIRHISEIVHIGADGKEETYGPTKEENTYRGTRNQNRTIRCHPQGYTYTEGTLQKNYNQAGQLIQIQKHTGESITLSYNEQDRLESVQKPTGEALIYSYDEKGRLTQVSDHTGRSITLSYGKKHLSAVTDPQGYSTCYTYGENNRLTAITNRKGIISVSNTYDGSRRCIGQTFPDGGETQYTYKDDRNEVLLTEPNGSTTIYRHDNHLRTIGTIQGETEESSSYDQSNNKTSQTNSLGHTTHYQYNKAGLLTAIEDPLGTIMKAHYEPEQASITLIEGEKQLLQNTFDEKGRLLTTKNANGKTTQIKYGENPYPEEIRYPDGSTMQLSYDSRNNITQLTAPEGSSTSYSYDSLNQVTNKQDGNGSQTRYSYDANGRISEIERADGKSRHYSYDPIGNITSITDYDGESVYISYDAMGNVSTTKNKQQHTKTYRYDQMSNLIEETEETGAVTRYGYDRNNRLSSITNHAGQTIRLQYDAGGNKSSVTDPLGNTTSYTYDAKNRLTGITDPEGRSTTYSYDSADNCTRTTYPDGTGQTSHYDGEGNLIQSQNEAGETTRYTYTELGRLATIQQNEGTITTYHYEKGGRLAAIQKPDGTTEHYSYDKAGNLTTRSTHAGSTTYTYDSLNRLLHKTDDQGNRADYSYAPNGTLSAITKNGASTQYQQDPNGHLQSVTDPCGNKAGYAYDPCGRITAITQNGTEGTNTTTLSRNPLGQIEAVTDSEGHTQSYQYDANGRTIKKQYQDGSRTHYSYTPTGMLQQTKYADGKEAQYRYDQRNRLLELIDWQGSTRFTYDAKGRITSVTDPEGNTIRYQWDRQNKQTSIQYPDGTQVSCTYQSNGKLSGITSGTFSIRYTYDTCGRLKQKSHGDGAGTTYSYDGADRITEILHQNQQGQQTAIRYTYDKEGRKTSITQIKADKKTEEPAQTTDYQYTYDEIGRLIQTKQDGQLLREYTFDSYGNRAQLKQNHGGKEEITTYHYSTSNRLLQAVKENSITDYQYDSRGNLIKITENGKQTHSYRYGADNRLAEASSSRGHAVYQYNALGSRIKQTVTTADGKTSTTTYLPDLSQAGRNLLGTITKQHRTENQTDQGAQSKEERAEKGTEEITTIYLWDSHIAGTINKEGQSYYLTDAQGSPLALYEADSHEEQESYHYDEYGNNEEAGTGKHPISYTGYLYDPISDSYHAKAREYDPKTGRYQSRDEERYLHPEIPISLNQYQYCLSNPISYTDPDGHECPSDEVQTPFSMEQLFMEAITAYRFGSSPEILQYYAWQMAECSPELLMRLQQKQKLELEVENYWNQENGYFSGPWWQDEKKLTEAYKYLLKETSYANLTMLGLAERFQEGVADNRIYALQELVGTTRTGKYEANTMIALKSVLLSQGVQDIDDFNPKLDTETLQTIRTWYNTSSKTGRYIGYWLENGGQDIIMGAGVIAVGGYAANKTKIDASVKKGIENVKNKISGKSTGKGGVSGSETIKVSGEVTV